MAKKRDEDLFKRMRSLGVRKSRAREVAEAVRNSPKAAPKAARKAAGDLSGAVVEIQDRLNHGPQKRGKPQRRRPGRESGTPRAAARPPEAGPHPHQGLISRRLRPELHPAGRALPKVQVAAWRREPTFGPPHHRTQRARRGRLSPTVRLQRRSRSRGSSAVRTRSYDRAPSATGKESGATPLLSALGGRERTAADHEGIRGGGDGPFSLGDPDTPAGSFMRRGRRDPQALGERRKGPPPTASWEIPIAAATARPSHPLGSFPSCSVPRSGELHARRRGSRRSPLSR